jgi:hypothetical protein
MNDTKTDGAALALKFANCTNEIERQIIVLLVEDLLAKGYALGVFDCEEVTLRPTRDEARIFAAMFMTDDDHLLVRTDGQEGGEHDGWIRLVYGNGGDVISDWTTNLDESTMARASELADRFSGRARARARRGEAVPDYKWNARNMLAGDTGASQEELTGDAEG